MLLKILSLISPDELDPLLMNEATVKCFCDLLFIQRKCYLK